MAVEAVVECRQERAYNHDDDAEVIQRVEPLRQSARVTCHCVEGRGKPQAEHSSDEEAPEAGCVAPVVASIIDIDVCRLRRREVEAGEMCAEVVGRLLSSREDRRQEDGMVGQGPHPGGERPKVVYEVKAEEDDSEDRAP